MNHFIASVSVSDCDAIWPKVEPWVSEALKNRDPTRSETLLKAIKNSEMQMYLVIENNEPTSVFITQINEFDLAKVCTAVVLGGVGMEKWLDDVEATITGFAKSKGCDYVELCGRRGWVRKLRSYGWGENSVTMTKRI